MRLRGPKLETMPASEAKAARCAFEFGSSAVRVGHALFFKKTQPASLMQNVRQEPLSVPPAIAATVAAVESYGWQDWAGFLKPAAGICLSCLAFLSGWRRPCIV